METEKRLKDLGDYLKSHRVRLNPSDYGIEPSSRRRTQGLRREEIAQAAGISVTLYTWLEQGRNVSASNEVLESISRAFRFNGKEREHLFLLAKMQPPPFKQIPSRGLSPVYQSVLDNFKYFPAYVFDNHWDVLAWNEPAVKVFGEFRTPGHENANLLWRVFGDPHYRLLFANWQEIARHSLAVFRASSACLLGEEWYHQMLARLQKASPEFNRWWHDYQLTENSSGTKIINHPEAGRLYLQHVCFSLADFPGLAMSVYIPAPDSDSAEKLQKLCCGSPKS